ncbi:hypothetical protein FGLOB1_8258 [Fusarium globosum]|uniref:Uncharacterized protein n=1 Tax=Fusarium globosum TaxID=78864 RepID=A0A8H5Y3P9_9HYPO|nr:hypothetical protein FGLOB1_8258 [Fusarium globosum]
MSGSLTFLTLVDHYNRPSCKNPPSTDLHLKTSPNSATMAGKKPANKKSSAAPSRGQKRKASTSDAGSRSGASGAPGPHLDTVAAPWTGGKKPKAPKHAMGGAAKGLLGNKKIALDFHKARLAWLDVEIDRLQDERALHDARCEDDSKKKALLEDEIKEMEDNSAPVSTPSLEEYFSRGRVVAKKLVDDEKEAKTVAGASEAQTIVTSTQEGNSASYETEFQDYFEGIFGALILFAPPNPEDLSTHSNNPQAFASGILVQGTTKDVLAQSNLRRNRAIEIMYRNAEGKQDLTSVKDRSRRRLANWPELGNIASRISN